MGERWADHHHHAAEGIALEPGSAAWSEWVKDYYRDIETYDWVDVADNLRGLEAFFHRNRARVVRNLVAVRDAGRTDPRRRLWDRPEPAPPAAGSVGVDINPRNVELLRQRLPNHIVIEGDVEDLPFADGSFGTVLCTEVIEHIPEPAAALAEYPAGPAARRCADRIGAGAVVVWRLRFLSSTCPHSEPFHNEYLPNEVRSMLRGWTIERLGYSLLHFNVLFVARKELTEGTGAVGLALSYRAEQPRPGATLHRPCVSPSSCTGSPWSSDWC